MSMQQKLENLRAEALKEAMASPALDMVRALDLAVVAAGGESLSTTNSASATKAESPIVTGISNSIAMPVKKVPQGDAAAMALQEVGPLPIGRLLEAAQQKGAVFNGEKPTPSFRSMLSKDDRFYSLTRNGMYFWWLNGVDLPEGFLPEPEDISDLLGSGSNTSQKGGGGHAANNT